VPLDGVVELEHEPALADPGDADECDELRRALVERAGERVLEEGDLARSPDERRSVNAVDADPGARLHRLPRLHRRRLALRLDRGRLAVVDRPLGRTVGLLADEDPVHGRGRLQPCRRVDDVAGRHRLPRFGPCVDGDERLAGVDPDAHVDTLVQRPLSNREGRPDGALRVVLVRDRRAEDRHRRVADELLDGPAIALELLADARVVAAELVGDVLRVELLRASGEADEVREQDGDDLPLPAGLDHGLSLGRDPAQRTRSIS
jgi:hypothetical protein